MESIVVNDKFKDRLFRAIFGKAEHKDYALSLYNAVNGTDYTNAEDLEIYTIEDVIYMSMKNDVSYLFANVLSLVEQQSTFNPNMPLRGLLYLAKQYDKYIKEHGLELHLPALQKIPAPQYIVMYIGDRTRPEVEKLRLSDAFLTKIDDPALEVVATVYNINSEMNKALKNACKPLSDYSDFVNYVKMKHREGMSMADAVDQGVEWAIARNLLDGFFETHKAEVAGMVLTEYDEAKTMQGFFEYGKAEGKAEGLAEGKAEGLAEGKAEGLAEGLAEALAVIGMTEEEYLKLRQQKLTENKDISLNEDEAPYSTD